jgi:hypothetical protein
VRAVFEQVLVEESHGPHAMRSDDLIPAPLNDVNLLTGQSRDIAQEAALWDSWSDRRLQLRDSCRSAAQRNRHCLGLATHRVRSMLALCQSQKNRVFEGPLHLMRWMQPVDCRHHDSCRGAAKTKRQLVPNQDSKTQQIQSNMRASQLFERINGLRYSQIMRTNSFE